MPFTKQFPVLTQVGENSFISERRITFISRQGTPTEKRFSAPAGMLTDRATIPWLLWGLIAPFGRQTRPAIIHDSLCYDAEDAAKKAQHTRDPEAYRIRHEADNLFYEMLRAEGAPPPRARLMWAFVSLVGTLTYAPRAAAAAIGAWGVTVLVALAGGIAAAARHDWPLALALLAPIAASLAIAPAAPGLGAATFVAYLGVLTVIPYFLGFVLTSAINFFWSLGGERVNSPLGLETARVMREHKGKGHTRLPGKNPLRPTDVFSGGRWIE